MKFSIIFGTRPEIIKLALVIKKLSQFPQHVDTVFTGQHYDYLMSAKFMEELGLSEPDFRLNCSSGSHAEQTSSLLLAIEGYLKQAKPDMVIVQGDTNTTLGGALAASKLGIPVAHIEAGCRSGNIRMPEEINRRIVDVISSLFFAPTERCVRNLLREGIDKDRIKLSGSTLGEVCRKYYPNALVNSSILSELGLKPKEFALLTVHRQESTDVRENLESIMQALPLIKTKVVFPIHPRARRRLKEFHLWSALQESSNVLLLDPLGYLDFLALLSKAQIAITDSGGVQEESALFHIPCVTLRETTEWWETIERGANILVGSQKDRIAPALNRILTDESTYNQMSSVEVYPLMNSSDLIVEKLHQPFEIGNESALYNQHVS